jgi:hypothetical protein
MLSLRSVPFLSFLRLFFFFKPAVKDI